MKNHYDNDDDDEDIGSPPELSESQHQTPSINPIVHGHLNAAVNRDEMSRFS